MSCCFTNFFFCTFFRGANCDKIGYTSHRNRKQNGISAGNGLRTLFAVESSISFLLNNVTCFVEASPDPVPESSQSKRKSSATNGKATAFTSEDSHLKERRLRTETKRYSEYRNDRSSVSPIRRNQSSSEQSSYADDESDQNDNVSSKNQAKGDSRKISSAGKSFGKESTQGSNPKVVLIAISLFLCRLSVSASIHLCFAT